MTAEGAVTQPFQWSSEYNDTELGMIYYNYRYYNPTDGRWTGRDPKGIKGGINLYNYTKNKIIFSLDRLGLTENGGEQACAACSKYIAQKQIQYATLIAQIKKNCKLSFDCEHLNGPLGVTYRLDNRLNPFSQVHIKIVIDCCVGATKSLDSSEDTFGHELVHAVGHCNNDDPDDSCIASICSEIRAYTVGGCKGKTGEELKECLKGRVPLSSEWFCKDKDMNALIEKYFDSCLEHYPH